MGHCLTKSATHPSPTLNLRTNLLDKKLPLRSYQTSCRFDEDLRCFDDNLHARTNRVIDTLAGGGVEVRALSFDSLKEVTGCLMDMNQEVVQVLLENKKDIWKDEELFELVREYFDNGLHALDFCTALEKCLTRARDCHLLMFDALRQLEEEGVLSGWKNYKKTLRELRNFKEFSDPFDGEFFRIFQSAYEHQLLMLEKLQTKKNMLDKKLRHICAWKRVSGMIFVATLAALLICSTVAAAVAAPPVAAAVAAASAIPIGSIGKWVDSLWKRYRDVLRGQKEVIYSMQACTCVTIKDLDEMRILIRRLENEIEEMVQNAERATTKRALKIAIGVIKKKLEDFMKNVDNLGKKQADQCSHDIQQARTVVLQRIIKYSDKLNQD